MTEQKAYRAAGWTSRDERSSKRLTSFEQAGLSDEELLRIGTERAQRFGPGAVTVGTWSSAFHYIDGPEFTDPPPLATDSDQEAEGWLQFALRHPFDDQEPIDHAHWAAQGILANLSDRGFDGILGNLDNELRQEIVDQIAVTIRRSTNRTPIA